MNTIFRTYTPTCTTYFEVISIKRQGATDQCVQDDSQTPDVHLGTVILLPLEEFGGSIRGTATERVQFITRGELVTETKVGNFDVHVGIE